jgi:putative flippase GtrA
MFFRFLLVGGSGFLIDAGLTYALIMLGLDSRLARIPAMTIAMAFTWIANRHFTYEVSAARSVREGLRYLVVAIAMALFNYLIYLVLVGLGIWPMAALTVATTCQTIVSFHAYRRFAFRD